MKARSQSQISTNRNSLHDKSLHTPNILLEKLIPNSSPSSTRPNSPVVLRKFGSLRLSGLKHDMSSLNTIANETNNNNNSNNNTTNNNNNNNSNNNHNNSNNNHNNNSNNNNHNIDNNNINSLDNNIGCLRSLTVIHARADERTRNHTLATRRKSLELEKQMFTVCKNIEEKYGKEERKILAEERSVRKKMLLKIICLSLICSKLIGKLSSQIIIEREVCRINRAKAIIVRAALKYGLKTQGKRRSKISNAMFCFTIVFIRMVRTYLLFLLNFFPVYFPFHFLLNFCYYSQ